MTRQRKQRKRKEQVKSEKNKGKMLREKRYEEIQRWL
jgi:hypothetical protein